jgi:hypothetical protein
MTLVNNTCSNPKENYTVYDYELIRNKIAFRDNGCESLNKIIYDYTIR